MRILFVDNLLLELRDGSYQFDLQPHLGLISLIAVARTADHEGILYDPKLELVQGRLSLDASLYRQIAEAVLLRQPDVVGITALGCNFICAAKIAAHLKSSLPELPILLGGPHATILDRQILRRFPQFDLIVRNEAENILLPVLAALECKDFHNIAGVTFRRGSDIVSNPGDPLIADLNTLPFPAYDCWPLDELRLKSIRVEAGRGCPFSCTFCSTATFFGRKYRLKSAERICAEMKYLNSRFGISDFSLTHDLFTVNRAKVLEFCDSVAPYGYSWACSARMDCVDDELLARMRAAGCRFVYYGLETGSQRMQQVVEKKQDLSMVNPILDTADRLGLFSTVSLITGYPQEEQADQDDTLDLVGRCFFRDASKIRVQLHLLTPEPGTKLMRDFANALEYDGHITDFNFPTLEPDDAHIMGGAPDVFMNHHYFRSVLPRERHVFMTSVFSTLHELGFPFLRHVISIFEGRFSRLLTEMYKWSRSQSREGPWGEAFVEAFVEARWGEGHYLYSLVKYLFTANRLSRGAASALGMKVPDRDSGCTSGLWYQLSHRAALLRQVHDCSHILELVASVPDGRICVPGHLATERADYCIILENTDERSIKNILLEDRWVEFYAQYERPHTLGEVLRGLQGWVDPAVEPEVVLASLLGHGILETVAKPKRTRSPRAFRGKRDAVPVSC